MFDPLTVAHEIKYPWRKYKPWPKGVDDFEKMPPRARAKRSKFWREGHRETFITVWHKDPCSDGSDNSCDWSGSKRKLNKAERALLSAISNMETILDNQPFYPDHPAHLRFQEVHRAKWDWLKRPKFRWHPRWHFHHWRIQIIPLQKLLRFLFERCSKCGRGYRYNEEIMGNWSGTASWHFGCEETTTPNRAE